MARLINQHKTGNKASPQKHQSAINTEYKCLMNDQMQKGYTLLAGVGQIQTELRILRPRVGVETSKQQEMRTIHTLCY